MIWLLLFLGAVCVPSVLSSQTVQVNCYEAKTCIHDSKEKCGIDKSGETRRFFDICDLKEYNCLKYKEFVRTSMDQCDDLPPLDSRHRKKY